MASFLLDENMPYPAGPALRAAGFDVEDVRNVGLTGQSDAAIVAYAMAHLRVIVTRDLDLGNVTQYPLGSHAGVVLMRYPNTTPIEELAAALVAALRLLPDADLVGNLVVLDPKKIRIRRRA